jgi:hypothetical protein
VGLKGKKGRRKKEKGKKGRQGGKNRESQIQIQKEKCKLLKTKKTALFWIFFQSESLSVFFFF